MAQNIEIADIVRELRESKKISQEELAARSGTTTLTISNIERGIHSPKVSTLSQIADALGVSIISFFANNKAAMDAFIKRQLQSSPGGQELGMLILEASRAPAEVRALAMAILSSDISHLDGHEYSDAVRSALSTLLKSLKQDH